MEPLLIGDLAHRTLALTEALAAAFLEASPDRDDASLQGGHAGYALLHAELEELLPGRGHAARTETHLDAVVETLGTSQLGASLYAGFTGMAWAVEHLRKRGAAQFEASALEPIDEALIAFLGDSPWTREFDVVSGLAGVGIYALERFPEPTGATLLALVVQRLGECAERAADGAIAWRTDLSWLPEETRATRRRPYLDLGVAHGTPGVLPCLAFAAAHGVEGARALLVGGARATLARASPPPSPSAMPCWEMPGEAPMAARQAWCYGDPGVAAVLVAAGHAVNDASLEAAGVSIGERWSAGSEATSGVVDACLCHGSAGLAQIAHRLWRATGRATFAEACRRWTARTLAERTADGPGAFEMVASFEGKSPVRRREEGLLGGSAGALLVLASLLDGADPTWDRFLALSLPAE